MSLNLALKNDPLVRSSKCLDEVSSSSFSSSLFFVSLFGAEEGFSDISFAEELVVVFSFAEIVLVCFLVIVFLVVKVLMLLLLDVVEPDEKTEDVVFCVDLVAV